MKTISKEIKSNCLFEAIKAKLKDWKNVRILKLGRDINANGTHYMWTNKAENKVYHFKGVEDPHFPFFKLRFTGVIQEDDLAMFNKFLYSGAKQVADTNIHKAIKKYNLEELHWAMSMHSVEDDEYPNVEEAKAVKAVQNMVQVAHKTKDGLKLSFIKVDDTETLNKALKGSAYWQYVTKEGCPFYRVVLGPKA